MNLHVLQFINSLSSGGAERFVVDLSNELVEQGVDISILTFDSSNPKLNFNRQFLSDKINIYSLGIQQKFTISAIHRFEKILKQVNPDIVHAHLNVLPYLYLSSIKNRKTHFIQTLHSLASNLAPSYQKHIDRWFYKNNLIVPVTISDQCLESYKDYFGLDNAFKIDNGRAKPTKSPLFTQATLEIEKYKIDKNTAIFINVARFHPQKNHAMLVDAFNQLHKENFNVQLLIIGNHFNDNPEGIELQKRAAPNIHFLGEKNNVHDYLLNSDYFCLTSFGEGLPISLLEALSCETIPICTTVGGIPDVLEDGKTGFLSKSTSKDDYVATIKRALSSKINRKNLSDCYLSNYSMDKCAKEYLNLYNLSLEKKL